MTKSVYFQTWHKEFQTASNNFIESKVLIIWYKNDEVVEENLFYIMQIKAKRWKLNLNGNFFCYYQVNNYKKVIDIIKRLEFTE